MTTRKANTVGERDADKCNGTDKSVTQSTVCRKRAISPSASSRAPSLHSLDEATDGELCAYLEENAFQVLAQKSVVKKPRVEVLGDRDGPFELNFAALSFPRMLGHIVGNDSGFVKEILSKQGDSKIFVTTNMKNFVRQLYLYGFRKVCLSRRRPLGTTDTVARESASKKQVFHNSSFRRGHPELLEHMKRHVRVRRKLASGSGDNPSSSTSRDLLPRQGSKAETSLDASDAPLDLSLRNEVSGTSTNTEARLNSTLSRALSILTETNSLAQGSMAEALNPAIFKDTVDAWISLSAWLLASVLAQTSPLASSALGQLSPNCGQNLLPPESP